jgi:hypothetical protein
MNKSSCPEGKVAGELARAAFTLSEGMGFMQCTGHDELRPADGELWCKPDAHE